MRDTPLLLLPDVQTTFIEPKNRYFVQPMAPATSATLQFPYLDITTAQ